MMIGAARAASRHRAWNISGLVATGSAASASLICAGVLLNAHKQEDRHAVGVASSSAWQQHHGPLGAAVASSRSLRLPVTSCEAAAVKNGGGLHVVVGYHEPTTTTTIQTSAPSSAKSTEEEEAFLDKLSFYQLWLPEIRMQWKITTPSKIKWPNNIPQERDISMLEVDLQMYLKQDDGNGEQQDLEFRIASYYLFRGDSPEKQRKGFNMAKKLAVSGHPDGLCLYAMVWNHGGVAGIEAKPHLAVKYWRQAAAAGHLASMYELGAALYMGDGSVEDPKQAVQYFMEAADLGHSGAAYMLADCYLDGVGVEERSRAKALEWLMTAAEMGHRQAQRRADALLSSSSGGGGGTDGKFFQGDDKESSRWSDYSTQEEPSTTSDWYRSVSLERRFTIGGGSRNPTILVRRKSAVAESRRSEE